LHQAEQGADAAEQNAEIHQHFAADAAQSGEFDFAQRRNFDVRLTGKHVGCKAEQAECRKCPQGNFSFFHKEVSRAEANKASPRRQPYLAKNSPKIELDWNKTWGFDTFQFEDEDEGEDD
jgi:hypothetical protein